MKTGLLEPCFFYGLSVGRGWVIKEGKDGYDTKKYTSLHHIDSFLWAFI